MSTNRTGGSARYAPPELHAATTPDDADMVPGPNAFTAATENDTPTPGGNPSTGHDVTTTGTSTTRPPGDTVIRYPFTGDPPSLDGADHDTLAENCPATADTPDGAPGTVAALAGEGPGIPTKTHDETHTTDAANTLLAARPTAIDRLL